MNGLLFKNYKLYMDNFYNRYQFCNCTTTHYYILQYNTVHDHKNTIQYNTVHYNIHHNKMVYFYISAWNYAKNCWSLASKLLGLCEITVENHRKLGEFNVLSLSLLTPLLLPLALPQTIILALSLILPKPLLLSLILAQQLFPDEIGISYI